MEAISHKGFVKFFAEHFKHETAKTSALGAGFPLYKKRRSLQRLRLVF
jgi:hypothetical protein